MKRQTINFLAFAFLLPLLSITIAQAGYYGRFDLGTYAFLPDDSSIGERFSFSERFRMGWDSEEPDTWSAYTMFRIKEEAGGEGKPHIQAWDLRLNYGLAKKPLAGSLGLCYMSEVAGLGSVIGGQLQTNPIEGLSIGLFGGANPTTKEGSIDIDGTRAGAYIHYGKNGLQRAGIGYVDVSGSDDESNDMRAIEFDTSLHFNNKVYFFQSGEYLLPINGESSLLSFYFGNVRWEMCKFASASFYYSHFAQFPHLQFKDDLESIIGDDPYGETRNTDLSSNAYSPRIDLRLSKLWRMYFRYRYRESDYFQNSKWDQYQGGVSCSDLFDSGISINASYASNQGESKDYDTVHASLSRNFGTALSVTVGYSTDKYYYPENSTTFHHVEDTQLASISFFYRLSKKMTFLLDCEKAFGKDDAGDNRILFNFQYKL